MSDDRSRGEPTLSVGLTTFAPGGSTFDRGRLLERGRSCDRAGVDRVIVVDHVVMGPRVHEQYEFEGFPTDSDGIWLEPLTVLSVLAGITERVRLATGVVLAALRPAAVLAKTCATLDVLSRGRLDLGVAVGWQSEEYEAVGLDFADRGRLLDETLEATTRLWRDSPARGLCDSDIWCEPKPVQPGGVPIWVGGRLTTPVLDRIVRYASGWIPWGEYAMEIEAGVARVRAALQDGGRDPTDFQVRGTLSVVQTDSGTVDVDATFEPLPPLLDAGVTDLNVSLFEGEVGQLIGGPLVLPEREDQATEVLEELVQGFREHARR